MLLLTNTLLKIGIWRRIDKSTTFGSLHVRRYAFECEISKIHVRTQSCNEIGEIRFCSCPPCSTVHRLMQKKERIDTPSLLNNSNNRHARLLIEISATWSSVFLWWTLKLSGNFSLKPEIRSINVKCALFVQWIRFSRQSFLHWNYHRKLECSCSWRSFCQLGRQSG